MSDVTEYVWPALTLEHDTATGWTNTRYPDGHTSGCAPVPDDAFHAEALGITPERHRLVHELLHHLVGFSFGYAGSPVVWRDAHDLEQDTAVLCVAGHMSSARIFPGCAQPYLTAEIEEWIATAYTYALHGKPHDAGAMMDVRRLCGEDEHQRIMVGARNGISFATDLMLRVGGRKRNAKVMMPTNERQIEWIKYTR